MRAERDPITLMGNKLAEKKILSLDEQEEIEKFYKNYMKKVVEEAINAKLPEEKELYSDVYADEKYEVKGINYEQVYKFSK
jgi:TPP-dependent pyruvate/acetoin dehydrogenase alpha subunit